MRLIDADEFFKDFCELEPYEPISHEYDIDAVEVVRCKDCNFCGEIDENGWHCCENLGVGMPKNGFCSDAERREE